MTAVLDKLERAAGTFERLEGLIEKIPRIAEMFGVALFAGRASERLGGKFVDGAIGGMVADGLAHSRLPNNQIGGISLSAYMAGIGLLNILPPIAEGAPVLDYIPAGGGTVYSPETAEVTARRITTTSRECIDMGGTVVQAVPGTQYIVCQLPEE